MTHALALGAGWAIYQAGGTSDGDRKPAPESQVSGAERRNELSAGAAKVLAAAKAAADETFVPGLKQEARTEAMKRIGSMSPPADIAAALDTLALSYVVEPAGDRPDSPEAVALIYHWLGKDPEEFFQWAKSLDGPTGTMVRQQFWKAVELQLKAKGAAALLPMLASAEKTGMGRSVANSFARVVALEADLDLIAKVKSSASKESWNEFIGSLYQTWPAERRAEFAKLAAAENKPGLLTYFNPGKPRAEWLRELMADESLPAEFREGIRTNPKLQETLASDTTLSLEERLAYAGKQDDAQSRAEICRHDVDQVLGNDHDWPRAFRRGEATAQEVLEAVRAATPELAAASPEALRDRVFERLVGEDPAGAMILLADLPAAERNARVLHTALREFDHAEPDRFLELLQQVPADTEADREARLDAWNRRSWQNDEEERENYTTWVQALPPGIDREMALFSLARVVAGRYPDLAESLRAQITDAELKQRIPSPSQP
ncbi:hypothetical protein [Haloferula sp. BvORR071]|uniref:hypothetical protein n=1 Tax=Haloferula sp. BvORR071 TaxID=1396141 RepID=UPI002241055E|nr:hypothetical protein [Haloferula sp. BvORR071]